jgi:Icc-related predicted phosphoesterase
MLITFISDTHERHREMTELLPGGDVIVCAGDVTNRGYSRPLRDFLEWFSILPYKHRIFIAGNHDFIFENYRSKAAEILKEYPDVIYLEDSEVIIDGVKFWGSPVSPWFHDWAFNRQRGDEIREYWYKIPLDTDVLITHTPPKGYGDYTLRTHDNVGCWDLFDIVTSQVKPKIHVFGHIHEGYGVDKNETTTFINASSVDFMYNPGNPPIVLSYEQVVNNILTS